MDFEEIYKEESGFDVGRYNIDNTNYYSEDYVKWLEEKLPIQRVSGMFSSEQLEKAFNDGIEAEQQRCGDFNIENYR